MNDDYTVLNDFSANGQKSHREVAEELLPKLREEMTDEEYNVDFAGDLHGAVLDAIIRDLSANLEMEDWHGMGFKEPEDSLDAEAISEAIGEQARWYFEDDQIGKSWDVLLVILEYAEEHGLVEREE